MVKLSVMYPHRDGAKFDLDYYLTKHLGLVQEHWGGLVQDAYVARGLGGGAPGDPPTYHIMTQVSFASMEQLNEALGRAQPLLADIPNFTDIQPVMQVSEVVS